MGKKVLVGLSGGVDSAVAAYLLQQQGYEVEGVFMKLHTNTATYKEELQKAQKVADELQIVLHVYDVEKAFEEKVIAPFLQEYQSGKTPNPCAVCNKIFKFGAMDEFRQKISADFLATGHYVVCDGEFFYQAKDDTKDQSYFLFDVNPKLLQHILFPLAQYTKEHIKKIAANIQGLEYTATQKESHDICFVQNSYTDVLKEYHIAVDNEGEVLNQSGEVIGKHKGYMHYTIGKRRGFDVFVAHEPHYVLKILPQTNQIVVGKKDELLIKEVVLENINMFTNTQQFCAEIKLRYRSKPIPCNVEIQENKAYVTLNEGVFGIAPGQAGVLYDNDKLLGGGWIL